MPGAGIPALEQSIIALERKVRRLRAWQQQVAAGGRIRGGTIVGVIPAASDPALGSLGLWENQSGAGRNLGDVVVQNGDRTFGVTVIVDDLDVIGVVNENAVAVGDDARVRHLGYQTVVSVQGAVVAGNFLRTSATAGAAEDCGASPTAGAFAMALTAAAGPGAGTVSAYVAGAAHTHLRYTDAEAIAAVEGEATLDLTGDVSIAIGKSLLVDTINNKSAGAGVYVEGVRLNNNVVFPDFAGFPSFWLGVTGGNPTLSYDAFDYIQLNANVFVFSIAAILMQLSAASGLEIDVVNELTAGVGTTIENVTNRDGSIELHHGTDTIAADEIIAPTGGYIIAAAQAGVADDLDGIGRGAYGRIIVVRAAPGHTITLRHNDAGGGAGRKLFMNDDAAVALVGNDEDSVTFLYDEALDAANGAYFEIGRAEPGAGGAGTGSITKMHAHAMAV